MAFEDEAGGILQRDALIGLNSYWRQKRFAYDVNDSLEYMGFHYIKGASVTDSNWAVWKLTYSGSNMALIEGPLTGIWDNRATLDWL